MLAFSGHMKLAALITRATAFAVFLVGSFLSAAAQPDVSAKIDRFVKSEMTARKIPGVSLAVLHNGKIDILKTYGFANLEHGVAVKPETIFQSGSMGKQFTAAAVMLLVQDGKLSLDDRIKTHLPNAPDSWKNITVRHLLTHTAGLGDYPTEIDLRRDYTEEQLLAAFQKAPLGFAPGDKWDYSNVGYATLGILIRKLTGKFYADFLQERIFGPLGMTTARVISEADIIPNRAAGYRVVAGQIKNQEWVSPSTNTTADGSLYFSILDLAKWDAALYTDFPLRQSTLAQIWEPVRLNSGARKGYGFGWFTDNLHNRRVVFHGGAWQGFKSCIIRFPDDKLTIIVLANSWNTREFKLARGVSGFYFPEFAVPATSAIENNDPKTMTLVRKFLLQLAGNSVDQTLLLPNAAAQLTPARTSELRAILNSLTLPVAIFHSEELVERRNENGIRVYRYIFNDIGKTLSLEIKLDAQDKIAAFNLNATL
jgi:CubicO group peptidase (beta-lactamase class C family)